MKKLSPLLLLISSCAWATYIPQVSSVTVFATQGGALPVSQTTDANLNASVSLKGSSNTVVATQTTDASLNASVSLKGSSNTVTIGGGSIGNTSFIATQSVDASLNGSVSIKASSNTVNASSSVVRMADQSGNGITSTSNALDVNLKSPGVLQVYDNRIATYSVVATTVGAHQEGTWTDTVTQSVDASLNASVSIKASSNTVNASSSVVRMADQSGNGITSTANAMDVNVKSGGGTGGTASNYGQAFPGQGTASGIKGDFGEMISQRGQSSSSSTYVYLTNVSSAVGNLADNGVAAATNRVATLPAVYQKAYLNGTAATQGNNAALSVLTDGSLQVWSGPDISTASYVGSTTTYTLSTTSMDVVGICGNSRTMVWIQSIRISCTQTTAGVVPITVAKRSTAYTAAFSTITTVALDSNYGVAGSTVNFFTNAGPQNGTLVGYVDSQQFECPAAATTNDGIYISPSDWKTKPIILRGSGQCLGVNFQFAAMSGAKITPTVTWFETATISP